VTAARPLRICFASLHYGRDISTPDLDAYLRRAPVHRELPRALAARGHEVTLVHLYPTAADYVEDGVRYRFVPPDRFGWLVASAVERVSQRDPIVYQPALRAIRLIRELRPDVIHFHGLTLTWNLLLLNLLVGWGRPGDGLTSVPPSLVVHYHGGEPATNPVARWAQRYNFRRASRLLFTARSHAQPFVKAGMIADPGRVVEFLETSTIVRPQPRALARQQTQISGEPVFLWVGRLAAIKDPLTALQGFEQIVPTYPNARLYLYFVADELLPTLRAYVASRPGLAARVEFRGRAPFEQMAAIYSSADFLLQASQREVCGQAVLEALACGVIPVVTDIPSFRVLTDAGRYGVLFPLGDAAALARGVVSIPRVELPDRSAAARAWFERSLSFSALGEKLERIYLDLLSAPRPAEPERDDDDERSNDSADPPRHHCAKRAADRDEPGANADEHDQPQRVGTGE
jgi:glycosyltransferase involved in cell wall biosynthesis